MKKNIVFLAVCTILFSNVSYSQESGVPTQTVKGVVLNMKNQKPVFGATVYLIDTKYGAKTNQDGEFRIKNVPVGRYKVRFSSIGYEPQIQNIVATSGKQVALTVQLDETFVAIDSLTVVGAKGNFQPVNEAAIISATLFTKDDVERFAGSRMDPARMAQNFAGVVGADDSRNDIIVRGGSPLELLWRLDGLDIPNPNHFATQGATGGPISAINSQLLDDGDFMTGAFPAEYGDRLSAVFDLKTRKGNSDRYEFIGQFGFNGFELGAEGPVPGANASFIANYRYSFLDLLDKMGFDFGFAGIPRYQDATAKFDLDAGDYDKISITALFAASEIDIKNSEQDDAATGDMDVLNGSTLFSIGANWKHIFSDKVYSKLTAGSVFGGYKTDLDSVTAFDNPRRIETVKWMENRSTEGYHTLKYELNYSPGRRHFITFGVEPRLLFYDLSEKGFFPSHGSGTRHNLQEDGYSPQIMSFVNWNWRAAENLTANVGVFAQYLDISEKYSLEPRLALSWNFAPRNSLSAGLGVHRQSLPLLVYFSNEANNKLDFMQSIHYVAGYSYQLTENAIAKIEAYYKDLSNIPVEAEEESSRSLVNSGTEYGTIRNIDEAFKSEGRGECYGAEISLTKNFADRYYFTATGSYVRQRYTGSDGVWRWGAFDNQFIFNLLGGYEIPITSDFTIEVSGKYTIAGGSPYVPIDLEESASQNETIYLDERAYSVRKPDYSKVDFRVDFRQNLRGAAIISYLSAENLFNNQNVLTYMYDNNSRQIDTVYQLGFFFVGGVRVEF